MMNSVRIVMLALVAVTCNSQSRAMSLAQAEAKDQQSRDANTASVDTPLKKAEGLKKIGDPTKSRCDKLKTAGANLTNPPNPLSVNGGRLLKPFNGRIVEFNGRYNALASECGLPNR